MANIAVFGAGVVGLSTALRIQQTIPGVKVTIVADRFFQDTTSYGAAGILRPVKDKTPGVPLERVLQWIQNSWTQYTKLAHSADAAEAGVSTLSGYQFFDDEREYPLYKDICFNFRHCTEMEMKMFPGHKYKHGWFCSTLVVQCKYYLPYLMRRIELNGGKVENRTVKSFGEFVGKYDLVVNCSGLGSRSLLNDTKITAIRGQIYTVKAPWLKHFIYHGPNCYIVPLNDGVVVGGVKQKGNFNLNHSKEDADKIMQDALELVPSLKHAEVLKEWVGLRPHREPLRVEKEVMIFSGNELKVVHNYGHGAEGVSLSWGTAVDAAQLVKEALQGNMGIPAKM